MKPVYICPVCGDEALSTESALGASYDLSVRRQAPEPGDIIICSKCAELLQFDEAMDLVMPSLKAINQMSPLQGDMIDKSTMAIRKKEKKMERPIPGERVGAFLEACISSGVANFIGFGVYEGDFVPPEDINPELNSGGPNPRLKMDDGQIVWGCECWWGPESEMKDLLKRFKKVLPVDMQQARKQSNEKPAKSISQKSAKKPSSADGDPTGWRWSR